MKELTVRLTASESAVELDNSGRDLLTTVPVRIKIVCALSYMWKGQGGRDQLSASKWYVDRNQPQSEVPDIPTRHP